MRFLTALKGLQSLSLAPKTLTAGPLALTPTASSPFSTSSSHRQNNNNNGLSFSSYFEGLVSSSSASTGNGAAIRGLATGHAEEGKDERRLFEGAPAFPSTAFSLFVSEHGKGNMPAYQGQRSGAVSILKGLIQCVVLSNW